MTDTPIRTQATNVVVSGGSPRAYLPTDWAPDIPVLVVAGLPERSWVIRADDVVDPSEEVVGVIVRQVPVPAPPATAEERMADALRLIVRRVGRENGCETFNRGTCRDEHSGRTRDAEYGAERWCDACVASDALTVLVEAPTGDDEPTCPAALSGKCLQVTEGISPRERCAGECEYMPDDEPQADTHTPEGRWTVEDAYQKVQDEHGTLGAIHYLIASVDQQGSGDAFRDLLARDLELVRRDGTAPDAAAVVQHMPPGAPLTVFDIERVLAAVRALRDGGTR